LLFVAVALSAAGTAWAQIPPQIITQPQSQSVVPGSTVLFSANVSGTTPLAYQWRKNGGNISGAFSSSYTLNNITTNDEAIYTLRVTNIYGAVTSSLAVLTVIVAPKITQQPPNLKTNVGATIMFTVLASGTPPLSYQWRRNGLDIPNATLNGYSLGNVQLDDSGSYSVFVSNGAGGVNSSNALLSVGIAPVITAQPSSLTVLQGQDASFSVAATGTPLSWFWRRNGTFIAGATNSSLILTNVTTANAGTYTVVVSNFLGSVTSAGAVLTVNVPASITAQPASVTVGEGSNAMFTVTAAGTAPLRYQWQQDGLEVAGATTSSYTVTNVQMNHAGDYKVVVSNTWATVTSQAATLTVLRYPPSILVQPESQTVAEGSNALFSVTATGTTLAYQWRIGEIDIVGANASSFVISGVRMVDAGDYTVVITNLVGSVTSTVATLTVPAPPTLQISQVGSEVLLRWPVFYAGYQLLAADDPTSAWAPLAVAVTTNDSTATATLPATNSQQYFRLQSQ